MKIKLGTIAVVLAILSIVISKGDCLKGIDTKVNIASTNNTISYYDNDRTATKINDVIDKIKTR